MFFCVIILLICWRQEEKQKLFQEFLAEPDEVNSEKLMRVVSGQEWEQLQILHTNIGGKSGTDPTDGRCASGLRRVCRRLGT